MAERIFADGAFQQDPLNPDRLVLNVPSQAAADYLQEQGTIQPLEGYQTGESRRALVDWFAPEKGFKRDSAEKFMGGGSDNMGIGVADLALIGGVADAYDGWNYLKDISQRNRDAEASVRQELIDEGYGTGSMDFYRELQKRLPEKESSGEALFDFALGGVEVAAAAKLSFKALGNFFKRFNPNASRLPIPEVNVADAVPADTPQFGALAAQQQQADKLSQPSGGFNVFHGSPHNFPPVRELEMPDGTRLIQDLNKSVDLPDGAIVLEEYPMGKFDISKIGTGEGAQVYGRGLYFAEQEDVARMYKDQLSGGASSAGKAKLDRYKGDVDSAIDDTLSNLKRLDERELNGDFVGDEKRLEVLRLMHTKVLRQLDDYKANGDFSLGSMYEVNIQADPDDFLDWDKTVGSQSQKVKSSLGWTPDAEQAYLSARNADDDALMAALSEDSSGANYAPTKLPIPEGVPPYDATGREVAGKSSIFGSGQQAAEALKNQGIPGIKYLDQGSRPSGDGTRNYVVFDDKLISIVKKYGIAGAATILGVSSLDVEQAMAQGLGGQDG